MSPSRAVYFLGFTCITEGCKQIFYAFNFGNSAGYSFAGPIRRICLLHLFQSDCPSISLSVCESQRGLPIYLLSACMVMFTSSIKAAMPFAGIHPILWLRYRLRPVKWYQQNFPCVVPVSKLFILLLLLFTELVFLKSWKICIHQHRLVSRHLFKAFIAFATELAGLTRGPAVTVTVWPTATLPEKPPVYKMMRRGWIATEQLVTNN